MVGSRICHDLISPLGAISNGVELLAMSGGAPGPEMNLISESVENANARIRFFRVAYGSAAAQQKIGLSEIKSILGAMSREGRFVVDWQPQVDLPRRQVKLAFLLLQCFETAMPWGGHVSVSLIGDQWAILGEASKLKLDPDLWETLSRDPDPDSLDAAHVHFALAPLAASAIGRKLTLESSETSIRVRF